MINHQIEEWLWCHPSIAPQVLDFKRDNHCFLALELDTVISRRLKSCTSSHTKTIGICRTSRARKIGRGKVALVSMQLVYIDMSKLSILFTQSNRHHSALNDQIVNRDPNLQTTEQSTVETLFVQQSKSFSRATIAVRPGCMAVNWSSHCSRLQ
jgi:hypothetical protein